MSGNQNYRGNHNQSRGRKPINSNDNPSDRNSRNNRENKNYFKHQQKGGLKYNDDDDTAEFTDGFQKNRKNFNDHSSKKEFYHHEKDYSDNQSHQREKFSRKKRYTTDNDDDTDDNYYHQSNYSRGKFYSKRKYDDDDNDNDNANNDNTHQNEYPRGKFYSKRKYDDDDDDDNDNTNNDNTHQNEYPRGKFYSKRKYDDDDDDDNDNTNNDNTHQNNYSRSNFTKKNRYDDDHQRNSSQSREKFYKRKRNDDDNNEDFKFQRNKQEKNDTKNYRFTTKIEVKEYAESDFFISLVNAYINTTDNERYFESVDGQLFMISNTDNTTILSYSPKKKQSIELMNRAIYCAETLMPYTPKTVIYHNYYPNCAIEVTVNGSTKYETTIHLINKANNNLPKAFNLNNKEIIEYMCQKVHELSSSKNLYRIALTAEALSFSLDDNHQDVRYDHISISNCKTVFGKIFNDKNRLIVLISKDEEIPKDQKELDWMIQNISQEEEVIQSAAGIAKGLVCAYHQHDLFVIKELSRFSYYGPDLTFQTSKIKEFCEYLFHIFTRGSLLAKDIDIKKLHFSKSELSAAEQIESNEKTLNQLFSEQKWYNIDKLLKRKEHLVKQVYIAKIAKKSLNSQISSELHSVKNDLDRAFSIKQKINGLKYKNAQLVKEKSANKNLKENILQKIRESGLKGRLIQLFNCDVFSSEEPVPKDQEENIGQTLIKIEKDFNIKACYFEKLVSATVVVSHKSTSPLSPIQFKDTIEKVCSRFSFIVSFVSDYIPQQKSLRSNGGQIGIIFVEVIDPPFTIIIVSEIKQALLGEQFNIFRIPKKIASKMMLQDKTNEKIIQNWITKNHLNSIKFNGENWYGSKKDVTKAYSLLNKSDTTIDFPEKVIQIPPFISQNQIKKIVHEKDLKYDYSSNCIIVKKEEKDKVIKFLSKFKNNERKSGTDTELNGCIHVCDNEIPSALPLTIYEKECIESTFDSIIGRFFTEGNGVDFEELMSYTNLIDPICIASDSLEKGSDEYWPKVPIGQLLWNLTKDHQFSEKAKAWLTAVLSQSLHVHPEVVTFCPIHPTIALPLPKENDSLHCSINACLMVLCSNCNQWHIDGNCPNCKWDGMRCPGCGKPTIKKVGCNHIHCQCGVHWCYKCGAGPFKSGQDCFKHMSEAHSSYYH